MHPQKTGMMLGFFLLTLLDIASFVNGKAFPGDKNEGNYDYYSKQVLGSQHQPFYRHQSFPPKTNLYYTPHVNGQPIFIPAISGSASHTDKLLDDYYERYKEYTQSWTLATPVTYNYDHGNQRDYYEDPVTSNIMVKNNLDETYQDGVHRGSYHILPIARESNLNHVAKRTEDIKNKSKKENIRKMDKKKKVKDFHDLSTKNPVSVNYDTKPAVSKDYSSEVSEINKKLSDIDYAPEVVEVDTKLDDDYAPEVVQIVGNKLPDDDYEEGKAEVLNEKLPDTDYAPEVIEVIRTELPDEDLDPEVVEIIGGTFSDHDYAPEVVEGIDKTLPHENYASEVVDVVNIKNHGKKKHYPEHYPPKTEFLLENIEGEDSDEATDKDIFTSKKDKAKIKGDKKTVKKPSKSSSKTEDYEEIEFVTKTSDKGKNKYQSPFIEEREPISEHFKTVEIKPDLRPATENFDEFKKADKTKVKSDKKAAKKPSKSSSKTDDYEEIEFVTQMSDKKKNKYRSPFTEEREPISEHFKTVEIKPDLRPATENFDEFKKADKTKVKSDKKPVKKPSKSSSKTGDYEEIEIVPKTSEKKSKYQSPFTEELETISEQSSGHLKTVKTMPYLRSATENLGEFKKTDKTKVKSDKGKKPSSSSSKSEYYEVIELVTKKPDTIKESSQKIRTESDIKHSSEDEYIAEEKHKVIGRKDEFIDDSESPLVDDGKSKRSGLESIENLSEHTFLDVESDEKLGLGANEALSKEPLNDTERFEAFDLENTGSGEPQVENDGNIRSGSQFFHNTDSMRSLSSLNSNIWSLIFNPNAEFRKSKKCVTRSNETGFCMYLQQCDVPNVITSLEELLNNACVIDDVFIGICCPEFPVQTVKVQWEQMPSNFGEHTEDEFGHNAEGELITFWCDGYEQSLTNLLNSFSLADCGIRSDEASKAKSWPWKAPLVSMSNGKIFCGGVIINEDYILTAAHCTTKIPRNQILVRLGQHDDSSGEDFAVVEIKRHAQYNPRTMHNDIALLKLGRRIVRDEQTDAVCLPDDDDDDDDEKEDDHAGERAVLLGWQKSFSKKSVKDEMLEVLTNEDCEKRLSIKVPPTFLCTEPRREDERTCNADSGAPLVIQDDDKYEVIGILSWNRDDCDQRFPSTFSRVSKYVQWIKKHAV